MWFCGAPWKLFSMVLERALAPTSLVALVDEEGGFGVDAEGGDGGE